MYSALFCLCVVAAVFCLTCLHGVSFLLCVLGPCSSLLGAVYEQGF